MTSFRSYSIQHIQLDRFSETNLESGNYFLVYWWKHLPMGHIWLETESASSYPTDERGRKSIADAIGPAMNYYLAHAEDDLENWRSILVGGNLFLWKEILERWLPNPGNSVSHTDLQVSVIVCTRNRRQALASCITALMNQSDRDFELIVIDNAPDDDQTKQFLKQFPSARYICEERKGLDYARNRGIQSASHPILAFTDDDVEVDIHWIRSLKRCFNDRMTMAVTGLILPRELRTESQYAFEKYWGFNKGYLPRTFDHKFFLGNLSDAPPVWDIGAGANMAFRKEIFELLGGFDTRLDVGAAGCSGDSEFWYRILASGWNCQYFPSLFVLHRHRESDQEFRSQVFQYMKGHACSLLIQYEKFKHRGNLRRLFRNLPGYYIKRIATRIRNGKDIHSPTIFEEIRGSLAGWRYYRQLKNHGDHESRLFAAPVLQTGRPPGSNSLVSVIIPCYNLSKYLNTALDSVVKQTHPSIEIIVVDDGSSDDPHIICRKYPNLRYVRAERVGVSAARNIGIQFSQGDYLLFLDADDWIFSDAIACNLSYFAANSSLAFVSGDHDRVDEDGNLLQVRQSQIIMDKNYERLLQGNYIGMEATVLYRRELFFHFHFDPRMKACEDYALNLDIARHYPVAAHTKKIAAYRIHKSNSSKDSRMMLAAALDTLERQKIGLRNSQERRALDEGIRNWKAYYKGEMARTRSQSSDGL
ncbi:MAG: glycosyltransferase [Chitinophagales bacterium]